MITASWIHPSLRDLVIEHLMANASDREAFLSTAGPSGVMLAVSVEGGRVGERQLPLLQSPEDWSVLGNRVQELIAAAEFEQETKILSAFEAVLVVDVSDPDIEESIKQVARGALDAFRARWSSDRRVLPLVDLRLFYELMVLVDPVGRTPILSPTWDSLDVSSRLLDDSIDYSDDEDLEKVRDWTALVSILATYEPRWLYHVGVLSPAGDSQFATLLQTQIEAALQSYAVLDDEEIEGQEPDVVDDSEYYEKTLLELLHEIIEMMMHWTVPDPSATCLELASKHLGARERRIERREEFEDYVPDPEYLYESELNGGDEFSIADFFSDL